MLVQKRQKLGAIVFLIILNKYCTPIIHINFLFLMVVYVSFGLVSI